MCRFKSGIILKSRVVIASGGDDSHSTLLENMGIEDSYINASKVFVRAELVPKNNEWWINSTVCCAKEDLFSWDMPSP